MLPVNCASRQNKHEVFRSASNVARDFPRRIRHRCVTVADSNCSGPHSTLLPPVKNAIRQFALVLYARHLWRCLFFATLRFGVNKKSFFLKSSALRSSLRPVKFCDCFYSVSATDMKPPRPQGIQLTSMFLYDFRRLRHQQIRSDDIRLVARASLVLEFAP